MIEELIQMARDMEADIALADQLGLNPDEIAFYRALIQKEQGPRLAGFLLVLGRERVLQLLGSF